MENITITMNQLERLFTEQKILVINKLLDRSGYYNSETTAGNYIPMKIDKEKFIEVGMKTEFPGDYKVLKQYIK